MKSNVDTHDVKVGDSTFEMEKIKNVYAVKFTNANIGSALEFDPDMIAASVDIFCYEGKTRYVHVIGKKRYKVELLNQQMLFTCRKRHADGLCGADICFSK